MRIRTRRVFAVVFSFFLVTATMTPATTALEPPTQTNADHELLNLPGFLDYDAPTLSSNGNGKGKGKQPTQTPTATTTPPNRTPTTTTTPRNWTTTTTEPGHRTTIPGANGSQGPPENRSQGPPENRTQGPPENRSQGSPENRSRGPPEDQGPPSWANRGNSNAPEDRGPPEWVQSSKTPPDVDTNRSALRNRSKAFANASVNVTIADDAAAIEYRLAAIDALQDADFAGIPNAIEQQRTNALEALNRSLQYVLDANRTSSAELFEADKEASTPPDFATNATRLLVHSDARLAATAIADAQRLNETLRTRNVTFNQTAVRENISAAQDAVKRAERFRDRRQYHVAVTQYKVAWEHAQQALDVMDLATTPNVTITTREDMPHDGNVTYTVRGRVFDVRSHEFDPLNVSLSGVNRSVPLAVNTTPGAVGTFETNLTLTEQVNRIIVAAADPNRRWASDDSDANTTTGVDQLRLDGDGLPDHYELNVTGTAPLDPDSNSTRTSANGVSDGAEDHDADGATTYIEYRFGPTPFDPDTDGDGLRDGFELQFSGIDPLTVHTDNDTVADSAEDLDNDTLPNRREQNASTSPVRPDTDDDTLNDSAELANGTNPLARDTDSDGLTDPDEYEVSTDPTVADTDGDGTLDGNETFSTTTENESVGAAVNISGEGDIADTVTIQNETNDQIQTETVENASASEVLDFEADAEFEQANLSIDYDDQQVDNESALGVYTYDPKLQTYVKLPSEVDATNDTVTGTTTHFSTFVVLNQSEWTTYMQSRAKPKPNVALNESFTDLGGWNCTGSCSTGSGQAVVGHGPVDAPSSSELLQQKSGSSDVGNECYTGPSGKECKSPGRSDPTTTETTTEGGNGGTDPGEPDPPKQLESAKLARSITVPSDTVRVTLSSSITAFAEESNASVEVVVSVGSESQTVLELQGEAGERVTSYEYVTETFEYPASEHLTFWVQTENLSSASVDYVDVEFTRDSDGDGLTNGLEELGIKTGTERLYTDPYDADTDGDGINDGQEVAGYISGYVANGHFELNSDPTKADSDSDGLDDAEEWNEKRTIRYTDSRSDSTQFLAALYDGSNLENHLASRTIKTDPYRRDSDDDGLTDSQELELGTDPTRSDTDGDGMSDNDEIGSGTDPTLYDYEGPEIDVFRAKFEKESGSVTTSYTVGYSVLDPSGLQRSRVTKNGEVQTETSWDGVVAGSNTSEFETGLSETILDGLTGTTVVVRASDVHGNRRNQVALKRSNVYGAVAEEITAETSASDTEVAKYAGLLSGITAGSGETAHTVATLVDNPLGFLNSLKQLAGLVNQFELVKKLLQSLPDQIVESFEEKQKQNNPYNPNDEKQAYETFRANWYVGYLFYYVASAVVGQQAKTAIKSSEQFADLVDRFDRNGRLSKAKQYYDLLKERPKPVKRAKYKLGTKLGKSSTHLTKDAGKRILGGAKTATRQVRLYRHLRKVDGSKIDDLSPSQEARLRTIIARTGDDGVDAINDLDRDTVENLLSLQPGCTGSDYSIQRRGGSCLDEETIKQAAQAVFEASDDGEVSSEKIDDAVQHVIKLDGRSQHQAIRLLADADADGIKLINYFESQPDLDGDDLTTFVEYTDRIDAVHRSDNGMTVHTEKYGIGVEATYAKDGEAYITRKTGKSVEELADLSNQERGDLVEDEIVPDLMEERGYTKADGFQKEDSNEIGLDYIAYDKDTNRYILVEAKFSSQFKDENIGKSILEDSSAGKQMTSEWITDAIERMEDQGIITSDLAQKVELALDEGRIQKSMAIVKNTAKDGRTIRPGLTDIGLDYIDIIQIGEVVK